MFSAAANPAMMSFDLAKVLMTIHINRPISQGSKQRVNEMLGFCNSRIPKQALPIVLRPMERSVPAEGGSGEVERQNFFS